MELHEELKAIKSELQVYKDSIDKLNAEKIAIDQMYVESLKSLLEAKKQLVLNFGQLQKSQSEVAALTHEKDVLSKEKDLLNKKVDELSVPKNSEEVAQAA